VFVVLLLILLGGAGGVAYFLRGNGGGIPALEARMGRFGIGMQPTIATSSGPQSRSSVTRSVEGLIGRGKFAAKIAAKLEQANITATPAEYVSIAVAILLGAALVGTIIHGLLGMLVLGLIGLVGPWWYLSMRYKRRKRSFEGQLADMAQMLANSMRAGFSILQSMEMVAAEGPSPAKEEFQRVVTEVELGLPIDIALDHLLERMPSEDLNLMVVAINVQRQVGGNLAEILSVISETVRARVRFQRDLRTMTAQARYSSYVITALPIGVGVVINFMDSSYESFLYTSLLGHLMLGAAVVMIGMGFFFLNKLASIEV